MPEPVIVGAIRTAIGRSFKGTLVNTPGDADHRDRLPRSSVAPIDPADIDDRSSPNPLRRR